MSRTAQALSLTQPALSRWLHELEQDIGLPLFERHARGLRPTPYGEALIGHARRVLAQLDSARDDMQSLRDGGSGLLAIGTSGASATETAPQAVAPAREVSMLFAALISCLLLGEGDRLVRLGGALCIAAGVVALGLG